MLGIDPRNEHEFDSQEQQTAMYDQPTLEVFDFDETVEPNVAAELAGLHIKPQYTEQVKKARGSKGQSLRDVGRNYAETKAQVNMREDMQSYRDPEFDDDSSELSSEGKIDARIPELAFEIINQYELTLSLAQWKVVQQMVESGIRTGLAVSTLR